MARNELTKNAMAIADLIRQRSVNTKDVHAADAATICRFKTDHLDKFCGYLDYLGLTVVDKSMKPVSEEELHSLILFAEKGIKQFGK